MKTQQSTSGREEPRKRKKSKFVRMKSKSKGKKEGNPPRRTEEDFESQIKKAGVYLKTWKNDRNSWKFEKMRQVWLIKNMFVSEKVKPKYFKIFLDYIANSQGKAREEVLAKALKVVQCRDRWTELQDQGLSDEEISLQKTDLERVSDIVYSRARLIVQAIPEV